MSSANDSRDDANIKHFAARAKQPKVLAGGPAAASAAVQGTTPVNVFIVFDQGFGGISDQMDATRFKYTGTSPQLSQYEMMNGRRIIQNSVGSTFKY